MLWYSSNEYLWPFWLWCATRCLATKTTYQTLHLIRSMCIFTFCIEKLLAPSNLRSLAIGKVKFMFVVLKIRTTIFLASKLPTFGPWECWKIWYLAHLGLSSAADYWIAIVWFLCLVLFLLVQGCENDCMMVVIQFTLWLWKLLILQS